VPLYDIQKYIEPVHFPDVFFIRAIVGLHLRHHHSISIQPGCCRHAVRDGVEPIRAKLRLGTAGLLVSIDQRFVVKAAGVVESLPWRVAGVWSCGGFGTGLLLATLWLSMTDTGGM